MLFAVFGSEVRHSAGTGLDLTTLMDILVWIMQTKTGISESIYHTLALKKG
jgi:hypothetical protein